ncbi:PIN domain-containing protein, partial [Elizabethkingia meningoseptica]|uniref:PIN domain-containing protein n=1 Tax=Elizabethkingia meningoseptica TaxID=238 RepID=UPI00318B195C
KREKFRDSQEQLAQLIQILMRNAILVDPAACGIALPDVKDVMFLDLALSGGATVLVSGNKRHFPETEYKGVRIVSPRQFLDMQDE